MNALDEKSIRAALQSLRENSDFVGMKNSALARSRADWLVGMNLSRLVWLGLCGGWLEVVSGWLSLNGWGGVARGRERATMQTLALGNIHFAVNF